MSMTLDDLMKTFFDAFSGEIKALNLATIEPGDTRLTRAGIRAVVEALRDEFETEMGKCLDCSASGVHDHIDEVFNDILGGAGDEKAAGDVYPDGARISGLENTAPAASGSPAADPCPHCNGEGCTPQLDRRGNVYPEPCQACETTGKVLKPADPSPEVCEWSVHRDPDGEGHYETQCGYGWMMCVSPPPSRDGYKFCPSCGKPIAFKEARP